MPIMAKQKMKTPKSEMRKGNWTDGEVALLTGGQDTSYVYGLTTTLAQRGIRIHVVGNNRVDHVEFHSSDWINFVDIGGIRQNSNSTAKLFQLIAYYLRMIAYVTFCSPKIIHILWNSKAEYFDRTFLMFYYKLLGKRVLLTAHNVNRAKRDLCDSTLNRLTLKVQYRQADRIFVHTEKMKDELVQEFGVSPARVAVIPFPVNILVPDTDLTTAEAKQRLGLRTDERTILFFGRIVPYKGLECLVEAFDRLARSNANSRLIIAGEPMKGYEEYIKSVRRAIEDNYGSNHILCRLEFIPEHETELYFKAADVVALPYKNIFESGVMFLAYRFGLPVIASDVGSFGEELAKSRAGLVFEAGSPAALAGSLEAFFESGLYKDSANHRSRIKTYSSSHHSWQTVGRITECVYSGLIKHRGVAGNGNLTDGQEADRRIGDAGATAIEKARTW